MRTLLCCSPTPNIRNFTVIQEVGCVISLFFPTIFIIVRSLFSQFIFCFVMLVMYWSYPWDSKGRTELVIHVNYSFLFKSNGDFKSKVLSQNYSYYISNLLSISLYRLYQHINHIYYNARSLGLYEILVNDSQKNIYSPWRLNLTQLNSWLNDWEFTNVSCTLTWKSKMIFSSPKCYIHHSINSNLRYHHPALRPRLCL